MFTIIHMKKIEILPRYQIGVNFAWCFSGSQKISKQVILDWHSMTIVSLKLQGGAKDILFLRCEKKMPKMIQEKMWKKEAEKDARKRCRKKMQIKDEKRRKKDAQKITQKKDAKKMKKWCQKRCPEHTKVDILLYRISRLILFIVMFAQVKSLIIH